ncbi:DCN1-like protein 4 isoform X2 [Salvia hispanica]|uniref:DCN1-like protein 4 isoform X2 n=1 Tax=Salvia hispanica TaxID=49212 RepID=UPI002009C8BF|nr:DCN1-like protein 4 isoform X2 [Salvia hispanica]
MTRASKRKSDNQTSSPIKTARVDSVRSASSRAGKKVDERIDELYTKYVNQSSCVIDPEGVEALCSDLKVDCTDVRILMLAWKMDAQKQGYFTQDEWRRGLKALKVDTIPKLKKSLPELEKEALKSENFVSFYRYAFRYCLTEDNKKCLDIETACVLLQLVLGVQYQAQSQSEYKVINMDQWTNFFRFCQEISFPDLNNYDSDEAWPLILDNYVDWTKRQDNVATTA